MASGGYRPGAGRPKGARNKKTVEREAQAPKVPADVAREAEAENLDPLTYMLKVMNDKRAKKDRRDRMAIAAAPFVHSRATEAKGKKKDLQEKAKDAAAGKYASGPPPLKLVK